MYLIGLENVENGFSPSLRIKGKTLSNLPFKIVIRGSEFGLRLSLGNTVGMTHLVANDFTYGVGYPPPASHQPTVIPLHTMHLLPNPALCWYWSFCLYEWIHPSIHLFYKDFFFKSPMMFITCSALNFNLVSKWRKKFCQVRGQLWSSYDAQPLPWIRLTDDRLYPVTAVQQS